MKCISCNPSDENNLIMTSKFWIVTLSHNQVYLGRGYITSKRHCNNLSELTSDEWSELHGLIQKIESTLKKTFEATMFNWTCLMNDNYKKGKPPAQVHWHVRPRYKNQVKLAGEVFHDEVFAHHYDKCKKKKVSQEILKQIRDGVFE